MEVLDLMTYSSKTGSEHQLISNDVDLFGCIEDFDPSYQQFDALGGLDLDTVFMDEADVTTTSNTGTTCAAVSNKCNDANRPDMNRLCQQQQRDVVDMQFSHQQQQASTQGSAVSNTVSTPPEETWRNTFNVPAFEKVPETVPSVSNGNSSITENSNGSSRNSMNSSSHGSMEGVVSGGVTSGSAAEVPMASSTSTSSGPIMMPSENDVLLGRGGKNNQWSGNEKLRLLALELSSAYRIAPKRNKPEIAWFLVTKMRNLDPPARFLKQDQAAGEWHMVDDDVAREKASQCLRDIVASRAKVSGVYANPDLLEEMKNMDTSAAMKGPASLIGSKRRFCSAPDITKRSRITDEKISDARNAVFALPQSNMSNHVPQAEPLDAEQQHFNNTVDMFQSSPMRFGGKATSCINLRGNKAIQSVTSMQNSNFNMNNMNSNANFTSTANNTNANFEFTPPVYTGSDPLLRKLRTLMDAKISGQQQQQNGYAINNSSNGNFAMLHSNSNNRGFRPGVQHDHRIEEMELLNNDLNETSNWMNQSGKLSLAAGGLTTPAAPSPVVSNNNSQFSNLSQFLQQQRMPMQAISSFAGAAAPQSQQQHQQQQPMSTSCTTLNNNGAGGEDEWALQRLLSRMAEE